MSSISLLSKSNSLSHRASSFTRQVSHHPHQMNGKAKTYTTRVGSPSPACTINFCFFTLKGVNVSHQVSRSTPTQPSHSWSLHQESRDYTPARGSSESTLVPPLLPVTSALTMLDDVASSRNSISDRKSQSGILNLTTDHSYGKWELSDLDRAKASQKPKL